MMNTRTKQNLNAAMLNEALAYAKYVRFAACARMNENQELAKLFQKTADVDRMDHFRREFDLTTLCSDDLTNLKAAIEDKTRQIDMYSQFMTQARADGDTSVANLFERMRGEALIELTDFEAALEKMERRHERKREESTVA